MLSKAEYLLLMSYKIGTQGTTRSYTQHNNYTIRQIYKQLQLTASWVVRKPVKVKAAVVNCDNKHR